MGWPRLLSVACAALVMSACGVLGGGAAPTPVPVQPTPVPATSVPAPVAKPAASPVASPAPTSPPPTAVPAASVSTVWVANTDGQGVYVRNTPVMADRARPYPDGTLLMVVGEDVDGDGQHWKHVKTPDELEGYVPSIYTVDTQP